MANFETALGQFYDEVGPFTDRHIALWINAFIPEKTTNARVLSHGAHKGQVGILGPFPWSGCFLSDNRMFSEDLGASVRMQSLLIVDCAQNPPIWKAFHRTGLTVELLCESGHVSCARKALNSRMRFVEIESGKNRLSLSLQAAASNPCVASAPDICYTARLIDISLEARRIMFYGQVTGYPAFEAYIQEGHRSPIPIFQQLHAPGASPLNLLAGAIKKISCEVLF